MTAAVVLRVCRTEGRAEWCEWYKLWKVLFSIASDTEFVFTVVPKSAGPAVPRAISGKPPRQPRIPRQPPQRRLSSVSAEKSEAANDGVRVGALVSPGAVQAT